MTHSRRRPRSLPVAAVVFAILAAGCQRPDGDPTSGATKPAQLAPVAVARGDVAAVITLDGVVVPSPVVTVAAPANGAVRRRSGLRPGARVTSGTPLFTAAGLPARTPVSGRFRGWLVDENAAVPRGLPVAAVTYDGFGIQAQTPPDLAYRIFSHDVTARAEIRGGPAAFNCTIANPESLPVLPDPNANRGNAGGAGPGPTVICAVPARIFAVSGMRAFLAIQSAFARDVLTLPTASVAGTAESGSVWLLDSHGAAHLHDVGIGISNGSTVEITSGLKLGDRVSSVAPDRANYR
jgi:macrolide-specific efflux system membrane fusion protein